MMRTRTLSRDRRAPRSPRTLKTRLELEALEVRNLLSTLTTLGPLVQVSGVSPFAGNNADAGQPGINFLNSEVEPSLAVDPTNSKHMVSAWQQDRWNNTGCRGIVTSVTFDGGKTWSNPAQGVVPGLTLVSGGIYQRSSDPWLSFASTGVLYLVSNPFDITDGNEIMAVSKSTDGGLSWGAPTAVITDTSLNIIDDKCSVTADPTNPNNAYVVFERLALPNANPDGHAFTTRAVRGPIMFARTTDGGQTWSQAVPIFDPGEQAQTIGNIVLVLPDGTLVDVFDDILFHRNNGGVSTFNIAAIRSTDKGLTWSAPVFISPLNFLGITDPNTGGAVRTGDIIPEATVDPATGKLYVVWQDGGFSGGTHADVAFSMSADGGFTWSTPIKINQTPTNIPAADQQAFDPSIAVAANGTLAVSYYDFRNNTSGPAALTDDWIAHATSNPTNPASWGNELRLTDTSFNIELAPTSNSSGTGFFVGDYQWLAVGGKTGTNFEALFCMPTATDPGNAFFRDPPAGKPVPPDTTPSVSNFATALASTPAHGTFASQPNAALLSASQVSAGSLASRVEQWLDVAIQDAQQLGIPDQLVGFLDRLDDRLDSVIG